MKAAICYEFGQPLVVEEIELAPPQAGEVRVKLTACAICHSDILFAEGAWGGTLPAVYGHEAAGIVAELGPEVKGLAVGDHVVVTLIRSCGTCHYCGQGKPYACETKFALDRNSPITKADGSAITHGLRTGAFAEEAVVHASQVVAIPKEVPLESASLLGCGVITGFGAVVNTASVPAYSSVVVIGTGGVGLNSVQGAVQSGASTIIAIDLLDEKLEAARKFGATHVINATKEDVVAAVKDATEGRGADYVFVTVGATKAIEQSYDLMGKGGAVVLVGMTASDVMTEYCPCNIADNSQRILGSKMGSARIQVDIPSLVALYQQGRLQLDELISGRYRLDEINDAIESVKKGEALRNVVVF